jgi:hypothetical protein
MRMRCRRLQDLEEDIIYYDGEPFWDDQTGRFGVYWNHSGGKINWYPPVIDGVMRIDTNGAIVGRTVDGVENNIALDWSKAGVLSVKDRVTGRVLAEFTENGFTANMISNDISTLALTRNLMINGDMSIKRNIGAVSSFITNPAVADERQKLFAPNYLAWCKSDSTGSMNVAWDEIDNILPLAGRVPRVLSVITSGNPTKCGIRVFFFDYKSVFGSTVNLSLNVKGTAGANAQIRFANSLNANLDIQDYPEADGEWHRVDFPVYLPPVNATWWAADILYEPSKDEVASQQWKFGAIQVSKGGSSSFYEPRTYPVQNQLVGSIYQEGRAFIPDDYTVKSVELKGMTLAPTQVDLVNPADGTATATDLDITGFNVEIPGLTNGAGSTLKYAAYILPAVA